MILNNTLPCLALGGPCYNESAGLSTTISTLLRQIEQLVSNEIISAESYLLLIDDGSRDDTWDIIRSHASTYVKGIKLSNTCGHQ